MTVWCVYCYEEHVGGFMQKVCASPETANRLAEEMQRKSDIHHSGIELGDEYPNSERFIVLTEEVIP